MRIGAIVVVVWLVSGVIAAVQRDFFSIAKTTCAEVSDTAVTILAGLSATSTSTPSWSAGRRALHVRREPRH